MVRVGGRAAERVGRIGKAGVIGIEQRALVLIVERRAIGVRIVQTQIRRQVVGRHPLQQAADRDILVRIGLLVQVGVLEVAGAVGESCRPGGTTGDPAESGR